MIKQLRRLRRRTDACSAVLGRPADTRVQSLFDLGTHFAHPDTYRSLALIAEYQGFFRTARLLESSAEEAAAVHVSVDNCHLGSPPMFNLRKLFSRARDYAERLSDILPYHVYARQCQIRALLGRDSRLNATSTMAGTTSGPLSWNSRVLMEKGFTESKARLALELAILLIKKGQD
jgi:hypothetical protein